MPTNESYTAQPPRQVERRGGISVPYTKRYPEIRGGTCEFCGTLDSNQPAEYQYKLCPHFRGMDLQCSYCDVSKNPEEVIARSVMQVHEHPSDKDGMGRPTLVVVCNSFKCSEKHLARFQLNR